MRDTNGLVYCTHCLDCTAHCSCQDLLSKLENIGQIISSDDSAFGIAIAGGGSDSELDEAHHLDHNDDSDSEGSVLAY